MSEGGPLPEPTVIYRKAKGRVHGGHHGGAWKVAYADFVTAMMAFFLLMWLLGASDERKLQGIADYFSPSPVVNNNSGGGDGVLAGRSLTEQEGQAPHAPGSLRQIPVVANDSASKHRTTKERMRQIQAELQKRIQEDLGLKVISDQIRLTMTPEGLRIDLIDEADHSMFSSSTADMDPRAGKLLDVVADVISEVPNSLIIRGHTDANPFIKTSADGISNNWALSTARAEATRERLAQAGLPGERFARLEGVADTEPLVPEDGLNPRNRRISITLLN